MTLSLNFQQPRENFNTELYIGKDLLKSTVLIKKLHDLKCRVALITDSQIAPLFGYELEGFLKMHGIDVHLFSFPAGEHSKTRETKQALEDGLIAHQFGRDTAVLALGGGVVTDLAGFLAATYCRGVPLILLPTTLLGMVDAALGGKTAVNTPVSKNFIGCVYPPESIFSDISLLTSLPVKELRNGTAEMIKHGLIASASLFHELEHSIDLWNARSADFFFSLIHQNCLIKQEVTEKDPFEKGYRRVLNFGHTIGHALETIENYQISHGEAVAIGIIIESYLSHELGHVSAKELERIISIFKIYQFPLTLSPQVTEERMEEVLALDKKSTAKRPRFVLLKKIGETLPFEGDYCTAIEPLLLRKVLRETLRGFR